MTKSTVDDDLTLSFILGREGGGLSAAGSAALSFVAYLAVAAAAATGVVSGDQAFACFVLVAVVLAWWSSPAAAAANAVVGFLFANGFAYDSVGNLAWHGEPDLLRLVVIVGLAVTSSVLGSGRRAHVREQAERAATGTWIHS